MSDKILYTGGPNPFKGLIGKPCDWSRENAPDIVNWKDHIDIFAAASDGLGTVALIILNAVVEVKPGDILDLPVGYEFKKGYQYHSSKRFYHDADWVDCDESQYESLLSIECMVRVVLRIVKTEVKEDYYIGNQAESHNEEDRKPEPKESQKELLIELMSMIKNRDSNYVLNYFTIHRKK